MSETKLTTGVKITVDASELDIKFLKSVDQLNAGLTKTQKNLKLTYNEQGLLTNALGQTVEGLSNSQIRLGQYVDDLGRVRTFQGGFTEGLNRSQIAMGQYADELGNIYDKSGELIGQTKKATSALEQQATETAEALRELSAAAKNATQSAQQVADSFGKLASGASELGGAFRELGKNTPFEGMANTAAKATTQVAAVGHAVHALKDSRIILDTLNGQLKAIPLYARGAAAGFRALYASMGPIGLALTAGAAALAAFAAFSRGKKSDLSEEFQKIEKSAKAAGDQIRTLNDALKYGAFAQRDEIKAAVDEYVRLNETGLTRMEQDQIEYFKRQKNLFGDFMAWFSEASSRFEHVAFGYEVGEKGLKGEKLEQIEKINDYITQLVESRKTNADLLSGKIETLETILKSTQLDAQSQSFLAQEIEITRAELKTDNRERIEKALGVSFAAVPTAAELFAAALKQLTQEFNAGSVTAEERTNAERRLAEKYAKTLQESGAGAAEINEAQKLLSKLYDDERLTVEGMTAAGEAVDAARAALADAKRKELAAATGADFSSADLERNYQQTLKELEAANAAGIISAKELDAARAALADQYAAAKVAIIPGLQDELAAIAKEQTAQERHAAALEAAAAGLEKRAIDQATHDAIINAADARLAAAKEAEAARIAGEQDARARELGLDALKSAAAKYDEQKNAAEEAAEALNRLKEAAEAGEITQKQYNEALAAHARIKEGIAAEERAAAEKKASDRANQDRAAAESAITKARAGLGIDAIVDGLRSPLDKYRETMAGIEDAAKINAITRRERLVLEDKAAEDYWSAINAAAAGMQRTAEKNENTELAQSMTGGSSALYLAQVKNSTANYQARMQSTTERMVKTGDEALVQAQQTNFFLYELTERANAAAGVWG